MEPEASFLCGWITYKIKLFHNICLIANNDTFETKLIASTGFMMKKKLLMIKLCSNRFHRRIAQDWFSLIFESFFFWFWFVFVHHKSTIDDLGKHFIFDCRCECWYSISSFEKLWNIMYVLRKLWKQCGTFDCFPIFRELSRLSK